jgi:hypothetical protein
MKKGEEEEALQFEDSKDGSDLDERERKTAKEETRV